FVLGPIKNSSCATLPGVASLMDSVDFLLLRILRLPHPCSEAEGGARLSYVLNTPDNQRAMLDTIGAASIRELFRCIPQPLQLNRPLQVPPALTEIELTQHLQALADRNRPADDAVCFLGGGSYDHFIPAVVDAVAGRSEYYTAYTPYQAEASQGSLQAFF